jgi:hypothetical protein
MTNVLVIHKDGEIEEVNAPMDKLYSVCEYKTNKDFELLNTYDDYEIYGKRKGKIGNENTYFADETYYGTLCILKKEDDLTIDDWNEYYDNISKACINESELTYESYESE